MLKTVACQRLQGRFGGTPAVPRYCADRRQVSACHCEERSDVAIRTPAAGHGKEQRLGRIRKSATDLPKVLPILLCASAGMRIATPVCALARNDMQKTDACLRLQERGTQ